VEKITQNGWNEWSKHVLKELERLNTSIGETKEDILKVRENVLTFKSLQDSISEFKLWKEKINNELSKIETTHSELLDIKEWKNKNEDNIQDIKNIKEKAMSISNWKGEIDEVMSPTQMKELVVEMEKSKKFRTVATTVWVIVQLVITLLLGLKEYIF
jgi:chromosome segregation ATPase